MNDHFQLRFSRRHSSCPSVPVSLHTHTDQNLLPMCCDILHVQLACLNNVQYGVHTRIHTQRPQGVNGLQLPWKQFSPTTSIAESLQRKKKCLSHFSDVCVCVCLGGILYVEIISNKMISTTCFWFRAPFLLLSCSLFNSSLFESCLLQSDMSSCRDTNRLQ